MAKGKGGGINIVLSADADALKKGLAEARAALSKTADMAEADQKRLSTAAGKFTSQAANAGSLRQQQRALTNLAASYEDMGAAGEKAFRSTLQQAGALRDRMGDLNMAVEAGHLEGRIKVFGGAMQNTIGIIAGAEGAMNMLGIKTEQAAVVTARLQSLMAMSQGIGSIIALKDAITALTLTSSTFAVVMKGVQTLLMPGPVLAIVAAVGLLTLAFQEKAKTIKPVAQGLTTLNNLQDKLKSSTEETMGKYNMLTRILQSSASSVDMKRAALANLQKIYPEYFKGLDLDKSKNEDITKAINTATDALKKRAMAMAVEQRMLELSNEIIKAQIELNKANRDIQNFDVKKGEQAWLAAKQKAANIAAEIIRLEADSAELTKIAQKAGENFVQALDKAFEEEGKKTDTKIKVKAKVEFDAAGALKQAYSEWAKADLTGLESFTPGGSAGMPGFIDLKKLDANLNAAAGMQRKKLQYMAKTNKIEPPKFVWIGDPAENEKQFRKFNKDADKMIDENGRRARQSEAQVNALNQGLQTAVAGSADAIGQLMEDVFSGSDTAVKDFGKNILMTVAGFMQTLGKAMIAAAVASDTFQKALLTNPAAAIAVGVGLVAAAGIVRGMMKRPFEQGQNAGGNRDGSSPGIRMFAEGGIISGPTVGMMGEYPGAKSNPEVVAPLNKLKDMIGGDMGGGQLMARISGQDLLIMLDRAETYRGRVR